jgi:hypothetical protein
VRGPSAVGSTLNFTVVSGIGADAHVRPVGHCGDRAHLAVRNRDGAERRGELHAIPDGKCALDLDTP